MVQLFRNLLASAKKTRTHFKPHFLDKLRLTVRGGHGGNGVPKYGGIGGQGGCVYLVAKDGVTLKKILQNYKEKRINASHGEDSSKYRILGKRGQDERIEVPLGIQVFDEKSQSLIGDLNEEDATCIVASGGMGGCSGTNFIGKPGEHRNISLDLKLIANVGLVGFPNAGKSTFLKAISNAKPKIASYPFTTIRPQIGTCEYPDHRSITIADLPGLIEGAHANFGMGHSFLKHIERTSLLLFVVDIFGFQLSNKHEKRNCLETIFALNKELELYDTSLMEKPCVLLLNKMDLNGATEILKNVRPKIENLNVSLSECPDVLRPTKLLKFERIYPISAINSAKINDLKKNLREILDQYAAKDIQLPDTERIRTYLEDKLRERGPKVT